jgi:phosphoglucosamine mutase
MCDETGAVFDGDALLAICAEGLQADGKLAKNAVAATVMSNFGLEVALAARGITLHRTDVGDRYVLQEMLAQGINLGGEQSGHLIALDYNTTGDGLMTSLLVLSLLVKAGKPLSAYRGIFTRYPQVLLNVPVVKKTPFEELPTVTRSLKLANERLGSVGRVLLRYSGTEAKARVMVECEREDLCQEVAEELASVIRKELAA